MSSLANLIQDPRTPIRLGLALLILGMVSSPLLMSLGVGVLFLNGMREPRRTFEAFLGDRVLVSITLIFFLYAISGFFSADTERWLDRVRTKLPFLLLPIAFAAVPSFERKELFRIIGFFLLTVCTVSIGILIYYLTHQEEVAARYLMGQPIPTPLNHIRFSLLAAYAFGCALWFAHDARQSNRKTLFYAGLFAAALLILFLHILAVRSGLLAAYLIAFYTIGWTVIRSGQKKLGLAAGMFAILGVLIAFSTVPTLKNRIAYTRYDLENFLKGNVNPDLSDAQRLGSIHTGIIVGMQNPVVGVGIGDINGHMQVAYEAHYPGLAEKSALPHNQWVLIFAGMGFLGIVIFAWSVFAPWFQKDVWNEPLFVAHILVVFPSFMTENTIENQLGVALYVTFQLIALKAATGRALGTR